jgi:hypothetical protein
VVRERILAEPELFLKTQRQPPSTRPAAAGLERDPEMAVPGLRSRSSIPKTSAACEPSRRRPIAGQVVSPF